MYQFILDDVVLPVAPSKLSTKVNNKNKTLDLVSIGEFNILKNTGLKDFSFEILLPGIPYPFMNSQADFKEPFFYLDKMKSLKENKKPFSFEIIRTLPDGSQILSDSIQVSLEEYTVKESAGEEGDFWVTISLKEFREIKIKTIKPQGKNEETGKVIAVEETQRAAKEMATEYKIISGDTLRGIARRELNDEARYKEIADLNGIKDPNKIFAGQVLKLP